jgi:hypothetical protein
LLLGVGFLCGGVGGEGGREDAEGLLTGDGERRMAGDGMTAGFPGGGACGDKGKVQGAQVRERGAQGLVLALYRPRGGRGSGDRANWPLMAMAVAGGFTAFKRGKRLD